MYANQNKMAILILFLAHEMMTHAFSFHTVDKIGLTNRFLYCILNDFDDLIRERSICFVVKRMEDDLSS